MASLQESITQAIADFDDIQVAIEEQGVEVPQGTDTKEYGNLIRSIQGYAKGFEQGLEQGFEDGKNSVVDIGEYCTSIRFDNLNYFGRNEITLNLNKVTSFDNMLQASITNTTVEHIIINSPNKITGMHSFIGGDATTKGNVLKHLTLNVDTQNAVRWGSCFRYAQNLEIIDGMPLDFSSASTASGGFSNVIVNCYALKEVRFAPNSLKLSLSLSNSNLLSTESIQSIIDGLADLTGQTAQTLGFHANVILKLTDEQWEQINNKNWSAL